MKKRRTRGRGIDFRHRFRTSRWAEELLLRSFPGTGLHPVRLGVSEERDPSSLEVSEEVKEPDLLVFEESELSAGQRRTLEATDLTRANPSDLLPGGPLTFVIEKALVAVEVEFSPYRAKEMKGRNWRLKTEAQLQKRIPKKVTPPTAPNVWVKEEDLEGLLRWERCFRVPIVVAHLFDQEGFAVGLRLIEEFDRRLRAAPEEAVALQYTSGIFKVVQAYDRVDQQAAGERKPAFRVTPAAAIRIGEIHEVHVEAQLDVSSSGKYVTHPIFSGGRIEFDPTFLSFLRSRGTQGPRSRG